jgi:hypothetical protein
MELEQPNRPPRRLTGCCGPQLTLTVACRIRVDPGRVDDEHLEAPGSGVQQGGIDMRIVEAVSDDHEPRGAHGKMPLELSEVPFQNLVRLNGEALVAADHDQVFAGSVIPLVGAV